MNTSKFQKYLPVIAVVLTVAYFGYYMRPKSDRAGDFNYRAFGHIPVIDGGRFKPMDSVARSNLMVITHRQAYTEYREPITVFGVIPSLKQYPATKWLLDAQTTPAWTDTDLTAMFPNGAANRPASQHMVFRIENDQLLNFLHLDMREGLRYSLEEIMRDKKQLTALSNEIHRVRAIDPKQLTLYDAKVFELSEHIQLYLKLSAHAAPLVIPNPDSSDQWKSFREAMEQFASNGDDLPAGIDAECYALYGQILTAYDSGDKDGFNRSVKDYLAIHEKLSPAKMKAIRTEIFFNEFAPFYHCLVLYVMIAILGALSWVLVAMASPWSEPIRKAAFASMAVVFLFHLSGLVLRMYLQNRMFVFVTNLYSSAVFIGLGCVLVCLIAESFYRNGIAIVVGSVTGFGTLIIAHLLSLSGDTMEMMQAVLDTNFWLATHVTCVTLGYTMAFVAGFMGIAYILLGMFTNMLRKEGSANLTRMTYGVLCGGMFLSFVGTVLGGLWADYSWGRFWGWDPKENGALLIVIWIALILHARWGGMVKHRGMAVLSVLGIIITSWSWFGTNFLGVGLHSYGFRQGAMTALIFIDLGFLAIAGLGLVPLHYWQSFHPPVTNLISPPKLTVPGKPKLA